MHCIVLCTHCTIVYKLIIFLHAVKVGVPASIDGGTGRKMEFPSPGNVPKMWNFLNVSGSRKCQCFRNISWYIIGQNFLYISWLPKTWPIRNLSCNHLNSKFPRHFLDLKLQIRNAWHFNIHYIIMQACKTWTVHRCSDELIKRLVHSEENIMTTKRNASMME